MAYIKFRRLPLKNGAVNDLGHMDENAGGPLGIGDLCQTSLGADESLIADLAAAFSVEGCLVHHDLHCGAVLGHVNRSPIADQSVDLPLRRFGVITEELGDAMRLGEFVPDVGVLGIARTGPGGAGLLALLVHRGLETRHVHRATLFAQGVLGEIEGKAVGVVQLEGSRTRQGGAFRKVRQLVIQQPQPAVQSGAEARFFQPQRLLNEALRAVKLRISDAHLLHQSWHQLEHDRILRAQHMRVAHGAAHDAAQNIAAPLVRRHHPIGNQERGRAQMVGDHPVVDFARTIRIGRGGMGGSLDQRAHQVGVVVVVLALEKRTDPLQPHAGVDALHLQGDHAAVGELLVLHEDVVPDLDEPVAVLIGRAGRTTPDMVAVVIENLGAGAAGTGRTHAPEVVVAGDADDLVVGKARHLFPDRRRLVIGVVNGDAKLVLVEAEVLGQQLPGEGNRLILEIVAEREIAQHLEKRMVPRGVADIVEVVVLAAGPNTFLRAGGAFVIPRLDPGEAVLELHHAGIGEHQRGIVARHKGRTFHDFMIIARKKVEEGRADVVQRGHEGLRSFCTRCQVSKPV